MNNNISSSDRMEVVNSLRKKAGYDFIEEELPPIIRSKIGRLSEKWGKIKSMIMEYNNKSENIKRTINLCKTEIILLTILILFTLLVNWPALLIYFGLSFLLGYRDQKIFIYSIIILILIIILFFVINIYSVYIISVLFIGVFIIYYKNTKAKKNYLVTLKNNIDNLEREFENELNDLSDEILKSHEYVFEAKLEGNKNVVINKNISRNITIKCVSCGAPLTFDPSQYKWERGSIVIECPYCGTKNYVNKDILNK